MAVPPSLLGPAFPGLPPAERPLREAVVERRLMAWGHVALGLVVLTGLAASFGLAIVAPEAVPAVPLAVVSAVGLVAALRSPLGGLSVAILLSLGLSGVADDYPGGKLAFGGFGALYLALWYTRAWGSGQRIVASGTDVAAALLLVFGLFGGTLLGIALGNPPMSIVGNVQAVSPLLMYFPVKEACARDRRGALVVAGCVLAIGTAAAVENAFSTAGALSSATEVWQIIDVRSAFGEVALSSSIVLCAALLGAYRGRWPGTAALIGLFGVLLGGLILTKSRGFWVATLLGLAVLGLALRGADRRRVVVMGTVGSVAFVGLAVIAAGPYVLLIATGIAKRFLSLSTAGSTDLSLLNRFAENGGVWGRIRESPVLGHGWGAEYGYYSLLASGTRTWSYVHSSYLGLWHKIGLWGLGLVLWVWGGSIASGVGAARDGRLSVQSRALGGAAAAALVALGLVANTSPPLENADQAIVLLLLWALGEGTRQRGLGGRAEPFVRPPTAGSV